MELPFSFLTGDIITPDFARLHQAAKDHPMELLDETATLHAGVRRNQWFTLTAIYACALVFAEKKDKFEQLQTHPWLNKRTYTSKREDALRLTLLIAEDADVVGPTYKRCCHITAKLQPLFDRRADPEEVFEAIVAAGGLEGLSQDDPTEAIDADLLPPEAAGTRRAGPSTAASPSPEAPREKSPAVARSAPIDSFTTAVPNDFELDQDLIVRMPRYQLAAILKFEVGDYWLIKVERVEDDASDWIKFQGRCFAE